MVPPNPATTFRRTVAAAALLAGLAACAHADECPTSTFQFPFSSIPPEEIPGLDASGSRFDGQFCNASFYFRGYGDSLSLACDGDGGAGDLTVRGRYRFLGPLPGTLVANLIRIHISGSLYGYGGDACTQTWASVAALQDQAVADSAQWFNQREPFPFDNCSRQFSDSLSFWCEHQVGLEFELAERAHVFIVGGASEHGQVSARLELGPLPPGAIMVRCDGDTTVQLVVGVGPSSVSSMRIDAIRPNPAPGGFQASLSLPAGGPTHGRLFDVTGRVVETRIVDAPSGARRELSFGGALAPGTYFLQAKRGAVTAVGQVVIRR